jgi:hypothetical protein
MAEILRRVGNKSVEVRQALADQTMGYVTAALSVVAGLAWNDAVKAAITYLFPAEELSIAAQFLYALVMTVIVVLLTMILRRVIGLVKPKV